MKQSYITKHDLDEALNAAEDRIFNRLQQAMPVIVRPLIDESRKKVVDDIASVVYDFMQQVDERFVCSERRINRLEHDTALLDRRIVSRSE